MKNIKQWSVMFAAILCMSAASSESVQAEEPAVSADIGAYSQYVWRGVTQTAGKTAVQGDLGVSMGGFSGSVWFSNAYASPVLAKDVVEFDWTLDYSGNVGAFGYSVGGIGYTYLYDSGSNFPEIYVGMSYDTVLAPSLTVYYNLKDSFNKAYMKGDMWVDLGVSQSVAGFDTSATLSYAKWKKDTVTRAVVGGVDMFKDGLSVLALGVSKSVDAGGVSFTPSLTFTVPLAKKQSDGNRYIYGVPVTSEFVAGVSMAY